MKSSDGWYGVDLDGTLAHYDGWHGIHHIGAPIPLMVERVKAWLAVGMDVRIFTARVSPSDSALPPNTTNDAVEVIQKWCAEHLGAVLPVTCVKDSKMVELWDDRAVKVVINTGEIAGAEHKVAGEPLTVYEVLRLEQENHAKTRHALAKAQKRLKLLDALEAGGVDNWEWYGEACSEAYGDEDDDEE